jgi:large subunit ribosomal protein L22
MEARCVARYVRIATRKMRLVANAVRGKNVNEAINILKFTPRYAAVPTLKAIESAVANLINIDDTGSVNPDQLIVKTIFADEGPTLKRFMPRAQGRATPIRKRTSHLTVVVGTPDEVIEAAEAEPAVKEEVVTESKPKTKIRKKKAE